jgi:hypothetical protein
MKRFLMGVAVTMVVSKSVKSPTMRRYVKKHTHKLVEVAATEIIEEITRRNRSANVSPMREKKA